MTVYNALFPPMQLQLCTFPQGVNKEQLYSICTRGSKIHRLCVCLGVSVCVCVYVCVCVTLSRQSVCVSENHSRPIPPLLSISHPLDRLH